MTRSRRLIRAIHAGLVCWIVNNLLGLLAVSAMPDKWVIADRTKLGLILHHVAPIIVVNLVIAAAFAFVVKLLLEYQHKVDLQEKSSK